MFIQYIVWIAAARASIGAGMDPVVKISLGNQDMCSSVTDDTTLTTMSMLTPDDDSCEDPKKLQVDATNGLSYDKLDFNRPTRQLKPWNSMSMILLGSFDSEIEISHHAYYMLHQHFSSQI